MKKFYVGLMLLLLAASGSKAQCPSGRYLSEIFPSVSVSTVTYSTPYSLQMDIYQPVGDTLSARPLIILAHGGSFVGGTRNDDTTILRLDTNFAKRGYVTASIDYRLTSYANIFDSTLAVDEVVKAISDGKAAIRYFVKDAATTNTYKIDTNNIFIGGNSAGAVLYMHVGYLDSVGECSPAIASAMAANGGFEGNSGNAGYTTKSKAIINLAGALNHVSFVGPGDKPSVNAQGTADNVVPYNCGYPLAGLCRVTLCGLGQLEGAYTANGIYHMSHDFLGDPHVPWDTDPVKFHTVDSMITVFLYNLVCTGIASVNEVNTNPDVSVFPNPASELLHIQSAQMLADVTVYDQTGRVVQQVNGIKRENCELNTSALSKGMYFVRLRFDNENNAPVVRKFIVE